jgi:uncharacterized protein YuzE
MLTTTEVRLTCTYDAEADAAYIYFTYPIEDGSAIRTLVTHPNSSSMINLDLDRDGRVLGVEVLDAAQLLPSALLRALSGT